MIFSLLEGHIEEAAQGSLSATGTKK